MTNSKRILENSSVAEDENPLFKGDDIFWDDPECQALSDRYAVLARALLRPYVERLRRQRKG